MMITMRPRPDTTDAHAGAAGVLSFSDVPKNFTTGCLHGFRLVGSVSFQGLGRIA